MPAWKIASGERESGALLDAMVEAGGPFIASTGMSAWSEIDSLVARLQAAGRDLAVLQCTSEYPTPLEHVGLNVLSEMRGRYGVPVGLSDHAGQTAPILAAIARGADVIEAHITLDRNMFGPDVPASLTVQEFRAIVDFRDALAVIDSNPVDKDRMAEKLSAMRALFGRSLSPVRALPAGTVITKDMLDAKKPSTGIPERQVSRVVGRRLVRDVSPERLLSWSDIEPDHDKA
jgi:N-acetylneuraminate synthase